jgi:aryl-alcohol dehydrogenase-like predicted oxidoreductase
LTISVIGFGAWGIGGLTDGRTSYGPTDDGQSLAALRRAFEVGVTFYDTANAYGDGHSEELIGHAFQGVRDRVVLASKVGMPRFGQPQDFSRDYIRCSLEDSLRRLRTDYLDLYQLHSPPMETLEREPDALEMLLDLQHEGKIRAWGVSAKSPADGRCAIERFGARAVQVNFNMIDQRALDIGLFELAHAQGAGIIVRTPLNFGFLTGRYGDLTFDPRDHRSGWSREQLVRWAHAPALFASINEGRPRSMTQLALQFCLAPAGVSSVIPGMGGPTEVDENVGAVALDPLRSEEIAMIRAIARENEFFVR